MSTEVWRVVADAEQAEQVKRAFLAPGGLADTAQRLHLPNALIGQIQEAIGAALHRAAERDPHGQIVVSARASSSEGGGVGQSWGFFLVERPPHEAQPHFIEVFLYPDRAPDESS
jgi:hypothetical protein